jgi:hypothetical protein
MYEIDFLPVESEAGPGSKSGDAITMHFSRLDGTSAVVVIDGGFADTGNSLVEHIGEYYDTDLVDIMISTHPDADHINGLAVAMEQLRVGELLIHQPRLHVGRVTDFSNIEAVDNLLELAASRKVAISEPFTGVNRMAGQLRILGPTEWYYKELVQQHLDDVKSGVAASARPARPGLLTKGMELLERALAYLPVETLTDDGETSPRNNTSVITLIRVDGRRLLFTGDAGIPALEYAAEEYEAYVGAFSLAPLSFLQAPHHGSKHNLGPTILNQMLGMPASPFGTPSSFISSAKASTKHPSPKVVNALSRRGVDVCATEGRTICWRSPDAPSRPGWVALTPLPALAEDIDDD